MNSDPVEIVSVLIEALDAESDALKAQDMNGLRLAAMRKVVLLRRLENVPAETTVGTGGTELRLALGALREAAGRNAALLRSHGEVARELIDEVNRRVAAADDDGTYVARDLLGAGREARNALPSPDSAP